MAQICMLIHTPCVFLFYFFILKVEFVSKKAGLTPWFVFFGSKFVKSQRVSPAFCSNLHSKMKKSQGVSQATFSNLTSKMKSQGVSPAFFIQFKLQNEEKSEGVSPVFFIQYKLQKLRKIRRGKSSIFLSNLSSKMKKKHKYVYQ